MPGVPKVTIGSQETHLFSFFVGDYPCKNIVCFYLVAYKDIPNVLDPEKVLADRRQQHVADFQGTVAKESRIFLSGVPGQEIELAIAGPAVIRVRLYVINGRLYELFVGGDEQAVHGENDGQMFFNSFSLKE